MQAETDTNFLRELFLRHEDVSKCFGSLSKLTRHLDEPVVITGSLATGWHLLKSGRQPKKRRLNDIDTVIVTGLSLIHPALSQDFLINHFHPYRGRGRVLFQLVDEEHSIRIDIFTPGSNSLAERLIDCGIGNLSCRIVSAEDLLAKLLSIIHSVVEDKPGVAIDNGKVTPYALAVSDLNHDGKIDVLVGYVEAPSTVYFNDGSGRHYTPVHFGDNKGTVYGFAIADLDRDGLPDIAVARSDAPSVVYFADAGSAHRY